MAKQSIASTEETIPNLYVELREALSSGKLRFKDNNALSLIAKGEITDIIKNNLSITADVSLKDTLDAHNIESVKLGNTLFVSSQSFTNTLGSIQLMLLANKAKSLTQQNSMSL